MSRKKLFKRLGILVIGIFTINTLANIFFWYQSIWWLDLVMHFLGGLFVALFIVWVLYAIFNKLTPPFVFWYVVFGVLIIALSWELFEFSIWTLFNLKEIINIQDSITDVIAGSFGSIAGAIYFLRRRGGDNTKGEYVQTIPQAQQYGTE